jgi:hypothetical protein
LPNIQNVKYVKRNDVRLKTGKSEEFNKILFQFLESLEDNRRVAPSKKCIYANSISPELHGIPKDLDIAKRKGSTKYFGHR